MGKRVREDCSDLLVSSDGNAFREELDEVEVGGFLGVATEIFQFIVIK